MNNECNVLISDEKSLLSIEPDTKLGKLLESSDDVSCAISCTMKTLLKVDAPIPTLGTIMKYFKNNAGHDFNLFAVLMPDWRGTPDKKQEHLLGKILAGDNALPIRVLFERLFTIIKTESKLASHRICTNIVYYVCNEMQTNWSQFILNELIKTALTITNTADMRNKILQLLVVELNNTLDYHDDYVNAKRTVLRHTECHYKYTSILDVSYDKSIQMCYKPFFELVFKLKENLIAEFKVLFFDFIEMHKQLFGEFYENQILFPAQLLYQMADIQYLVGLREFIKQSLPSIQLLVTTSYITQLQKLDEFYVTFDDRLSIKEHKLLKELVDFMQNKFMWIYDSMEAIVSVNQFKKLFKNTPTIRKLLFGRNDANSPSLFEVILTANTSTRYPKFDTDDCILNYIWTEFELVGLPELFTIVSITHMNTKIHAYFKYLF